LLLFYLLIIITEGKKTQLGNKITDCLFCAVCDVKANFFFC
jgi:hypothetical protein